MASERSVEQSRSPMDKNRITSRTRPDERATDREAIKRRGGKSGGRAMKEGGALRKA
jgi:hypothetical protein